MWTAQNIESVIRVWKLMQLKVFLPLHLLPLTTNFPHRKKIVNLILLLKLIFLIK